MQAGEDLHDWAEEHGIIEFFHHTGELLMEIAYASAEWAEDVGLVDAFEEAGEWVTTQVDGFGNVLEEVWEGVSDWVETDVADWFD